MGAGALRFGKVRGKHRRAVYEEMCA
jgi:hypothetical protein